MKADILLKELIFRLKGAFSNAELLRYNLQRLWGWKRRIRWIYQQFEDVDGRDSILIRYLKFMLGLKETDYQAYELIRLELDLFQDNWEVKGFPIKTNRLTELITLAKVNLAQIERLATV